MQTQLGPEAGKNEGNVMDYAHIGITAWLVVTVAIIARMDIDAWDEVVMSCGLAICWPVTAPLAATIYMCLAMFDSARKIKHRLKDKGLEREFYEWLDARNNARDFAKGG